MRQDIGEHSATLSYLLSLSAFSAVLLLFFLSLPHCSPSHLTKSMVSETKTKLTGSRRGEHNGYRKPKRSLVLRALSPSASLLCICQATFLCCLGRYSWIELDALENKQVLPQPPLPKLFFVIDFLPTDRVLQGAAGW